MIYTDMRDAFLEELFKIAKKDKNVILLLGDQGAKSIEKFYKELPEQVINCGPAEQNIINVAAGLASCGKRVFIHGITPFITLRCFEQISLALGLKNYPVTIVGIGTGISYAHEGPTHHSIQDIAIMKSIPNMNIYCPADTISLAKFINIVYETPQLSYIRFDHDNLPLIYDKSKHNFKNGLSKLREGEIMVISSGNMTHYALKMKNVGVIDLYKITPLNKKLLLKYLKNVKCIFVLEENLKYGNIASTIADFICDNNLNICFERIGLDDYVQDYGKREDLLPKYLKWN